MGAKVRLLGPLRQYQPEADEQDVWIVPAGTTVKQLFEQTKLDDLPWEITVTLNGAGVLRRYELKDDDELVFTALFLGG